MEPSQGSSLATEREIKGRRSGSYGELMTRQRRPIKCEQPSWAVLHSAPGVHRYLSVTQLAEAMGVSKGWLYHHIKRLQRDYNFPLEVSAMGVGKNRRFDAVAVEAWQTQQQPGHLKPQPATLDEADLDAWRAELDRRAKLL